MVNIGWVNPLLNDKSIFLLQKLKKDNDCRYLHEIHQKNIWISKGKNHDWNWLIRSNFIYNAFSLNHKFNMSGQRNPSKWKNRIYYVHFSVHLKCQCILFNISDVTMHLFWDLMWISFIMQANDHFDKCLYIISFLLWSIGFWDFLGVKRVWRPFLVEW